MNANCNECGAPLPLGGADTLCPACGLELGLSVTRTVAGDRGESPAEEAASDPQHLGRLERYVLLEEIARGGMGAVFKARQKGLNRLVALKMIIGGQFASREHVLRFRAEAEAAAQLHHPNIVAIHETGELDGQPFFSMEYIEGRHLGDLVRDGPLPGCRAATYARKIAEAVHFAHEQGILHRDLKPSNILIDGSDEPRITDFGLAKRIQRDSFITVTGQILGSPQFMSPEQASAGRKAGRYTDVHGLGGVLYFLLTGRAPFDGNSLDAILTRVLHEQPVSPRLLNPSVPADLETICLKCLEKEPGRRYPTAQALADDLGRFLRDEPIVARPVTRPERAWRWCRRNPALSGLCAAVGLLLLATIILFLRPLPPPLPDTRPSVAVLLTAGNNESRYLVDWFSGELVHRLSQLSGVRVLPPNEVRRFQEQTLERLRALDRWPEADAVLAVVVTQTDEENFELSLELMGLRPHKDLGKWSSGISPVSEAPRRQVTVMRFVADALGVELTKADQALMQARVERRPEAVNQFREGLRNRERLNPGAALEAVNNFARAVELDPEFADAYAKLAEVHLDMAYFGWASHISHFEAARTNLSRALEIDPTLAGARISQGVLNYFYDWDWEAALEAFEMALRWDILQVQTHTCYFHVLAAVGRHDEAMEAITRASEVIPDNYRLASERGCLAYYLGRFQEAETFWRQSQVMEPANAHPHWGLGRTLAQMGRYGEALEVLREGRSKPGGDWSGLLAEIGYTCAKMDDRAQAEAMLEELRAHEEQDYLDYFYAMIHAGLGDADQAFASLEAACDKKSPWLHSFVLDPKFLHLRGDPRYGQIAARLNHPSP
jgi:serine/threonine protein kinase/tetratricopeptide (TPR) repeat protein